ncbi:MAG: tetratricopeptide repeat protein [Myxococcales bacterium]|nr:tetratricopeptide repeat protein [Myxococcales bacterium]
MDEARGELGAARVRLATARGLVAGRPAGRTVAVVIERDEAWLAWRDGGSDEAVRRLTALLATLGADEPALLGPVHNALGVVAYGRGAHAEAERHYRLALAAFEALGDLARMSSAYNNLGILAMRQGDYAGAEGWFQRGLRIKAEGGDREGLARAYNNLGTLHGETGDYARAAQFLAESIRIRERSGHAGLAVGYANLGEVFLKQGRFPEARARLRQAIDLCAAGKGPGYLLPDAWRMLAELGLAEGHAEEAAASASEALRLASESGDRPRAGVATRVLGEARAALGDADADAVLAAAVEVLADLEQPLELARAYAARARCWQGDAEAARAWRAEADRLLAAVGARG